MPIVSIIVPVYKVEKYLPRCIESILAQTLKDIELILIDDGSPDRCGEICDEYAARDARIKVIHQENRGVSAARNAGLDIAQGVYIGFVDSDDWIEPEMYEVMTEVARRNHTDVVICGIRFINSYDQYIGDGLDSFGTYNTDELLAELFGMPTRIGRACWNKIILSVHAQIERFPTGINIAEDTIYLFKCLRHCSSAYKIPNAFYNVVNRDDSATRNTERIVDSYSIHFKGALHLLNLAKHYSTSIEAYALDKYLDDCIRFIPVMRVAGKDHRQPYRMKVARIKLRMLKEIIRAYFKKLLPKAKLHGYIYGWFKV